MEERRLKSIEKERGENFTRTCEIWHNRVNWDREEHNGCRELRSICELISHEHVTNFHFACLCKTISSHAKLPVLVQNCDFGTNLKFF